MRVVRDIEEFSTWCGRYAAAGLSVGFVPTMGALHEGHLSLLRRSVAECERTVVSVFVNPTQFGPGEDLDSYPRRPAEDEEACREQGASLVYFGSPSDMYPAGFQTWVEVESLTRSLCGIDRPHHFRGVTTVVAQLFLLARPDRAYFGQKDFQQARVIQRMAIDLHMSTDVRICPTVRERDGLALSSRNAYLDAPARTVALRLSRALFAARERIESGERNAELVRQFMRTILRPGDGLELDYLEIRSADDLSPIGEQIDLTEAISPQAGLVIAVAARVGGVRLIDNVLVGCGRGTLGGASAQE